MGTPGKYLIIGGSTKCGTTSVFNYFEFHPEICPCRMKESRFFLNKDYAMHAAGRDHSESKDFGSLFGGCRSGQTGLEATPDYLYSAEACERIWNEVPGTKMIFILRHPVNRLLSWYRFARMHGLIGEHMTFDTYVDLQRRQTTDAAPQHLKSLEHGNYYPYLERYIRRFGKENVMICFYEDLSADPLKFCKEICAFAGIHPAYFDGYNFRVFNRSSDTHHPWLHSGFRKFKRTVRPATRLLPGNLRKRIKLAGHSLEESVVRLFSVDMPVHPGHATLDFLKAYYEQGIWQLRQHCGVPGSWLHI